MTAVRPFDPRGPLPRGVTVLEASAGTGKTYTIAGLAARYVAEGTPLDRLLLVTFTRMATGELRDRVRERLVFVERALAGGASPAGDAVAELLAEGPPAAVERRRRNLEEALADFDAATVATIHGFCQEVLGELGVAGDVEDSTTFLEDDADLLGEVVDDLFVRRFHSRDTPEFDRAQALRIAEAAVRSLGARLEPAGAPEGCVEAMRVRLAEAARRELDARKRRMAVMTYDDLLTRLRDALAGGRAASVLRRRFGVVLVDEFQDTDRVQWEIFERAFVGGATTLVLIGDPKQAIYAFRGADVYAYLDAARTAGAPQTLDVNWRSDQGLIDAYDALFDGARLGHEGIVYRRVRAAPANEAPRLLGAPVAAALRARVVHRADGRVALTRYEYATVATARAHIAEDLAADVARLLSSGARLEERNADGTVAALTPLRPGHVAVLVSRNRTAALIRDALAEAGIRAVIGGGASVFATAAARDWLVLLEALERPADTRRARAAALTPFVGWPAELVASAGDAGWERVHRRLHRWTRILRAHGVAALMEAVTAGEGLPARVLAVNGGERALTDLRHVAQLLHAAATSEQLGATALSGWLRRRIAAAERENADEERIRRLESDADAVQVLTIHRSKGLEFPIVYCPDLWEPGYIPAGPQPIAFHDASGERVVDVGLGGPDFRDHQEAHRAEQRGEDLRLAYVALTRARLQAIVWWAGSWESRDSALGRLLFARDEEGNVAPRGRSTPPDARIAAAFEEIAARVPGRVSVERAGEGPAARWAGEPREPGTLAAAALDRRLDQTWRRTSYSDITAGAYEARVASEPEEPAVEEDRAAPAAAPAAPAAKDGEGDEAALRAVPALLAGMPVGTRIGTLVHRMLEATDFAAGDLDAELTARLAEAQARRAVEDVDPEAVVAGLRAAIETPLGPLAGGARLRDLGRADRLDELDFELPLAGGDEARTPVGPHTVAGVLAAHLAAGDPLASYAERLRDPVLRPEVRGYLTGSIDLVARLRGPSGEPRFAVVDYKTNWLAAPEETLSAWHHRPAALAAEMREAHYGLQALLYLVALHRYLRWRLPGYDPGRHLAGVLYLFLRGMTGPGTPAVDGTPCGVFAWRPPDGLVPALSDALEGAAA